MPTSRTNVEQPASWMVDLPDLLALGVECSGNDYRWRHKHLLFWVAVSNSQCLLKESAFSIFFQDLQEITHGNRHRLVPPDHDVGLKADFP